MSISAELAAKLSRMSEAELRSAMRRSDQMAEEILANRNTSAEVKEMAVKLAESITEAATNLIIIKRTN